MPPEVVIADPVGQVLLTLVRLHLQRLYGAKVFVIPQRRTVSVNHPCLIAGLSFALGTQQDVAIVARFTRTIDPNGWRYDGKGLEFVRWTESHASGPDIRVVGRLCCCEERWEESNEDHADEHASKARETNGFLEGCCPVSRAPFMIM